jgi:ribosome-dependent ATPase
MDCSTARPRSIFAKIGGRVLGLGFPTAWYQLLSVGTITKGLGFEDLWLNMLILAVFFVFYFLAAKLFLRKQET